MKILSREEVISMTGFSKSTLYNRNQEGTFPPAINLGGRRVGFVQSECEIALQGMIAGFTKAQMKILTSNLLDKRLSDMKEILK